MLWFQKALEFFFPTLITHRQVVLLISGLMPDPTPIIHFVYEYWIQDGYKMLRTVNAERRTLIEAMFREAALPVPTNLLHNQWINYYDHSEGFFKDKTPVYVPSRIYWFNELKSSVNIQHGNAEIPECTIWISSPNEAVVKHLLSICQEIGRSQKITNLYLRRVSYQHPLDLRGPIVFNMSNTAQSVKLHDCILPPQTLTHLIQQLNKSSHILVDRVKEIDNTTVLVESLIARFALGDEPSIVLRNCSLTPKLHALYYPLTHTRHWKQIDTHKLRHSTMPIETLHYLIQQVCGSKQMEMKDVEQINDKVVKAGEFSFGPSTYCSSIKLDHCTIPSQTLKLLIEQICGWNQIYMKDVQQIDERVTRVGEFSARLTSTNEGSIQLDHCTIPLHTINRLMQEVNQCSKIKRLYLPHTTLTGCLSSLLSDPHPDLPALEELNLRNTGLNEDDLQYLAHRTHSQQLPNLQILDLSENALSGCLSSFLPDRHPGLSQLEKLNLRSTSLNKDGLQHLFSFRQSNKLPNLRKLDLSRNTLTGCLSSFLPDPHPGLPELYELNLRGTGLNKDDLQHLSHITQSSKLPKLQVLDVSQNTLTGCLLTLLPDSHPGLPELEELYLQSNILNKDDLQNLSNITQSNKLRKLRILDLSQNTLAGTMSSFLIDPHPGLPELEELYLRETSLNKEDLQHLLHIMECCKLPKLRHLTATTGCLSSLLHDPHPGEVWIGLDNNTLELRDLFRIKEKIRSRESPKKTTFNRLNTQHCSHMSQNRSSELHVMDLSQIVRTGNKFSFLSDSDPGLPEIRELKLKRVTLNKEDLQYLSNITQRNKLPKLQILDLSQNILTGCLTSFLTDPHPGLPKLTSLYLKETSLNKEDLHHISHITHGKTLPNLQILDLSNNTLTGCLSSFLPDPHTGLPKLEELHLCGTALNEEDLQHLTRLIETRKLPRLTLLNIGRNKLNEFKTEAENLLEACVNCHEGELRLLFWLSNPFDRFTEKLKEKCQGTHIQLCFSALNMWIRCSEQWTMWDSSGFWTCDRHFCDSPLRMLQNDVCHLWMLLLLAVENHS